MKLTIQPIERKEFVNLPEREPDDFLRALRTSKAADRELLGQSSASEGPRETPENDAPEQPPIPEVPDTNTVIPPEYYFEESMPLEAGPEPEEPRWKRSKWPAIIFAVALAVFGTIWYFASRSDQDLKLAKIRIEGASLLSKKEILALADVHWDVPFYRIDLTHIEQRLREHSLIRSAHVWRELDPPTLVISIQERKPVALLRSDSTNEAFIVDRDGKLLRPKLIAGLRNPATLLQVPLLSGVSEHDTAGYQAMAQLVTLIGALDSARLANAIGELHRTPTGDYVIYTSATQTPIFIGSPFAHAFRTSLEEQAGTAPQYSEPLFNRQLELLARAWKDGLQQSILMGRVLYVDARFNGQIVLKQKSTGTEQAGAPGAPAPQRKPTNAHYATNAITTRSIPRTTN